MKTTVGFLFLLGFFLLVVTRICVACPTVNFAYVDLSHAILRSDNLAVTRFEQWSDMILDREHSAAMYGVGMLAANQGVKPPAWWLRNWMFGEWAFTMRGQTVLFALSGKLALSDVLALLDSLDTPSVAKWLVSAASRRPDEVEAITHIIEERNLISSLSSVDRVKLGTIYSNLAWQKKHDGAPTEEFMPLIERALALNPRDEQGTIQKAVMLYQQDQREAGRELLATILDQHPNSADALEAWAGIQLQESNFQATEAAARRAIELGLSSFYRQWLLATALYSQGRCVEALPLAESAHRLLGQDHPMYLLLLGDVYWCIGDQMRAVQAYARLETVAPNYRPYVRERLDMAGK